MLAVNLIAPMRLARPATARGGSLGMALAVGLLWLVGDLAGVKSRRTRFALIAGGVVIAVTQVVPVLQLIAGGAGLGFACRILGIRRDEYGMVMGRLSEAGGFLATLLTGGALLSAAWVVGSVIRSRWPDELPQRDRAGPARTTDGLARADGSGEL